MDHEKQPNMMQIVVDLKSRATIVQSELSQISVHEVPGSAPGRGADYWFLMVNFEYPSVLGSIPSTSKYLSNFSSLINV